MGMTKNTWGMTCAMPFRISSAKKVGSFSGSSLSRKRCAKKMISEFEELMELSLEAEVMPTKKRPIRTMSPRTKSKIRKKIQAFAGIHKRLSFLTLTFVNKVSDERAIKILRKFLDNAKKQFEDFQYVWIAERQSKNKIFPGNIHFHIITNKYWNINKWIGYWIDLQAKFGVLRRNEKVVPGSAFDVSSINSNNVKGLINYVSKYVTKENSQFSCQVWNCSKKISALETDFYSDMGFLEQFKRLEAQGLLAGKMKVFRHQFCDIHFLPLDRTTMNFYERLNIKNRAIWNSMRKK